ncbi:MAG TPA: dihydrofolate reductase family protein [Kribbella sp.]|jgi:riboflavin biosynthesis pyrimidine reductase
MSIDGYLDTATDKRLVLSNDADLDRVDAVRADSDAILVGAATLRNDNPGCWCVHRHGAPSAPPAAGRQPRSR